MIVKGTIKRMPVYETDLTNVKSDIIPYENGVKNLGSSEKRWNEVKTNKVAGVETFINIGPYSSLKMCASPEPYYDDSYFCGSNDNAWKDSKFLILGIKGRTTDPSTKEAGDMWYRSDLNQWKGWNGTTIVTFTTS